MPQCHMLLSATPGNRGMATVAQQRCQALSLNQPCTPRRDWATGLHKQEPEAYRALSESPEAENTYTHTQAFSEHLYSLFVDEY